MEHRAVAPQPGAAGRRKIRRPTVKATVSQSLTIAWQRIATALRCHPRAEGVSSIAGGPQRRRGGNEGRGEIAVVGASRAERREEQARRVVAANRQAELAGGAAIALLQRVPRGKVVKVLAGDGADVACRPDDRGRSSA